MICDMFHDLPSRKRGGFFILCSFRSSFSFPDNGMRYFRFFFHST